MIRLGAHRFKCIQMTIIARRIIKQNICNKKNLKQPLLDSLLVEEKEMRSGRCPLGIMLLGEDKVQVVSAKTYTAEEEIQLVVA